MFGYFFSKTDLVSGTIWPVIRGLETTATVTVPELLSLPPPLVPPPEHAATASTAATLLAAPSLRSLTREELMNTSAMVTRLARAYACAHLSMLRSNDS